MTRHTVSRDRVNVTLLQRREKSHLEEHPVGVLLVNGFTVFVAGGCDRALVHQSDQIVELRLLVAGVVLARRVPVVITGLAHREEERSGG